MTGEVKEYGSAEIQDILNVLPHRYPFLLVDRVMKIDGCFSCVGIKNVTMNELHFTGHFPDHPVMPGVLIVEGMAQTAGVMFLLHKQEKEQPKKVYFLGIDKARFRKPVFPGDVLEYHVETLQNRRGVVCKFSSKAQVRGECVAEAEFLLMLDPDIT